MIKELKYLFYIIVIFFFIFFIVRFYFSDENFKNSYRSISQLDKKIKDSVLVLIGDGPMKKQYLDIAKEYNMEENVFFIDAVPYDKLSIFASNAYIGLSLIQQISKSYEHALPNKLFEYAVSGLPVICSNLKAMQQFVSKYKNGIAIDHANEKEFIDVVCPICKDNNTKTQVLIYF